ncbi:MAG: 3-isopropylmalate dehydratase small subunit [Pseudomonadota bacterium]
MEKFKTLHAIAAPLMEMNIDTDMIIPKQFLKTITRTGLGKSAFHEMRTHADGTLNKDFILNIPPYDASEILVTGANFGCGSSREHAPWALKDFGFKCVIAESFADIFYNNCFENGILPAIIAPEILPDIISHISLPDPQKLTIDLEKRHIICGEKVFPFRIDDFAAKRLLEGLDTIGLTLQKEKYISDFETRRKETMPWL